ncbi:hypothetical protein Ais01nite_14310 [Asanoa ishikariensis]|uniref:Uncharacterized protein n=1 Tax=Asanoa ishikariensis TaxID=137265 RepID=A0A1H3UK10_9ACTN|nr:hypothetical protein [Asanoa ishikariensis]GIF63396.1 hypothetical protein Ais01nite_14310 [Asanoa ishikariensis]SDZ62361.1 hypothetical protein SAMN05421684_7443 [Asanoa ishikariensis]
MRIAALVEQLASGVQEDREAARDRLIAHGKAAVEPVLRALCDEAIASNPQLLKEAAEPYLPALLRLLGCGVGWGQPSLKKRAGGVAGVLRRHMLSL